MVTEARFQQSITKKLKDRGCLVYKFASPSNRGVPDLVVILPGGRTIYIEVKSPKGTGRLTTLQRKMLDTLRAQGCGAYLVDSEASFNHVIESEFHSGAG